MKTTTLALFAVLTGLAVTTARAENRGYVGTSSFSADRFGTTACPPTSSIISAPISTPFYGPNFSSRFDAPRGYWKEVPVRTWMPAHWTMSRDRWGRSVRILEPAHYVVSTRRTWIDNRRG